ncbi:mitotic spindle assembly checkpoint protein MAD2B [Cryptococcus deuterogattii 99/473]|uniref:Unplaced genomic scaffold supercont1.15, whole genome shotgun sequence n=1 Tax=Cryptococcus deuterogattii Ram5 TaxID=1296110 RepID=A0A0D0UWH0_9TREE|nr:mitotic spindle assembly checkpoint protein MAD2B [Cryptococcus deuterogattii Ram5]KIY55129.1 mitotic spindle assembly checkpoint protein MAD2B [Cryptococcus deuterogattii 99/473]
MAQPGLSYKVEISLHTILCIRQIYPPTTFTRRRAHGVPVYQSRHPTVRTYISQVIASVGKEIHEGRLKRMTVVIKSVLTGLPVERMIFDIGYLSGLDGRKDIGLTGAPNADELGLMLRGFLIKLSSLDGQLLDNNGTYAYYIAPRDLDANFRIEECTFAIIIETNDDLAPSSNTTEDTGPWVPALAKDTLRPSQKEDAECPEKHEPLLSVKAIETGVIDVCLSSLT